MSNKDENKGDQRADERSIAGVTENEGIHTTEAIKNAI